MSTDTLRFATHDLERALEEASDDEARYHIRQAAQRIVAAEWDRE